MAKENGSVEIPRAAPLVEVRRGPLVESRHRGHVAAVAGDGALAARLGEPETVTYLRSSAKPHQAVPLVASGAADRFGFDQREIATWLTSTPIVTTAPQMMREGEKRGGADGDNLSAIVVRW